MINSNSNEIDIYWEKQELWRLCGLHCLNSIMQGPFFNEVELSEIAHELDKREKKLMAELGTETEDFLLYMAQDSFNVSEDGNFSVQVLEEAAKKRGLEMILIDTKKGFNYHQILEHEVALICNSTMHWFALRKLNNIWYDLNSTNNFPEIMDEARIIEFFEMCKNFQYMLFIVKGPLCENTAKEMKSKADCKRQHWFKESFLRELNGKPSTSGKHDTAVQDLGAEPAALISNSDKMSSAVNKFEVIREENAENIIINFRMPNTELVSYVFPRIWHLEDLYGFVNYLTNGSIMGRFQIISNYPELMVFPPTKIVIGQTNLHTGQTLFVRMI